VRTVPGDNLRAGRAGRARRPARTRRDVPLRRSLLLKLLVLSALVSACSIAATAWLTAHVTAVAVRQEQGQALTDDAKIYDALLGYAATHRDWSGVGSAVADLARSSGHRVTLTDRGRRVIVDSAGPGARPAELPAEASATVDPLSVDTALVAQTQTQNRERGATATPEPTPSSMAARRAAGQSARCPGRIRCLPGPQPVPSARSTAVSVPLDAPSTDAAPTPVATVPAPQVTEPPAASTIDARAVGPFRLTSAEHTALHGEALRVAACLRDRLHLNARVGDAPSGRPVITTAQTGLYLPTDCDTDTLAALTGTERHALAQLDTLVDSCLDRHHAAHIEVGADFGWSVAAQQPAGVRAQPGGDVAPSCIDTGRREQLASYVAPPVLLFVGSTPRTASAFLDLSGANRARIAEVTGLVLLLTLTVTALAGTRMVRPLRALAGAARRMTDGDLTARVRSTANDEIGGVAAAFNTMAERREQSEGLRKAMVSDVAHELRTPLSNIRGWLEAAEDGLVVPDRALLSSLLDEAVLLQHVIDDLRDLSAADAGELRLHPRTLDLAELLGQVATAHRGTADAAGVTLLTAVEPAERSAAPAGPAPDPRADSAGGAADPSSPGRATGENRPNPAGPPAPPWAEADPVRLRQAVGNLVSNAIRHTPAGGAVTVRAQSVAGGGVVIEVADTGSGIAAEDLPRVFDRFWRAEKSRSRQTGGSGLGLSIVRKLAEAHGGSVAAASGPGPGSVFTIIIPGRR
jgi:two-component system sensor histidine kinase BaeS